MPGGPSGYCTNCQEYSDDEIKELSWDDMFKRYAPIRYYFKKLLICLIVVVFLPPIFFIYIFKRFFRK